MSQADHSIDIPSCVADCLFENHSVVIPDFGAFITTYRPAQIEPVKGLIHPPSRSIEFVDRYESNSALLLEYIRRHYNMEQKEVTSLVRAYVESLHIALEKREILSFPNIGRLYKDFEDQYQFIQESTNYLEEAFGLPTIHFFPIQRSRDVKEKIAAIRKEIPQVPQTAVVQRPQAWRKYIPAMMAAATVLFAVALFVFQQGQAADEPNAIKMPVSETRINQKPAEAIQVPLEQPPTEDSESLVVEIPEEDQESAYQSETETTQAEKSEEPGEETTPDIIVDTEAPTIAPDQHYAIIIVGAFSKKEGAMERSEELFRLGYDVYTDKSGNLTRIGVQFPFDHGKEVREELRKLRKKYSTKAYVLKM